MNNSTDCGCGKKELLLKSDYSTEEIEKFIKNSTTTNQVETGNSSAGLPNCAFIVKIVPDIKLQTSVTVNVKCEMERYSKAIKVNFAYRMYKPTPGMWSPPGLPCSQTGCGGKGRCGTISGYIVGHELGEKRVLSIGKITETKILDSNSQVNIEGGCFGCDTVPYRMECVAHVGATTGLTSHKCEGRDCISQAQQCDTALEQTSTSATHYLNSKKDDHLKKIEKLRVDLEKEVQKAINTANSASKITTYKRPKDAELLKIIDTHYPTACSSSIKIKTDQKWSPMGANVSCEDAESVNNLYKKTKAAVTYGGNFTQGGAGYTKCVDLCKSDADCLSTSGSITAVVGLSNILNEINKNGER